jgi:hypothetical protein
MAYPHDFLRPRPGVGTPVYDWRRRLIVGHYVDGQFVSARGHDRQDRPICDERLAHERAWALAQAKVNPKPKRTRRICAARKCRIDTSMFGGH